MSFRDLESLHNRFVRGAQILSHSIGHLCDLAGVAGPLDDGSEAQWAVKKCWRQLKIRRNGKAKWYNREKREVLLISVFEREIGYMIVL